MKKAVFKKLTQKDHPKPSSKSSKKNTFRLRGAHEAPRCGEETLEAMEEARCISRDPGVKGFAGMEELKIALDG